jgi:hypothetical protein
MELWARCVPSFCGHEAIAAAAVLPRTIAGCCAADDAPTNLHLVKVTGQCGRLAAPEPRAFLAVLGGLALAQARGDAAAQVPVVATARLGTIIRKEFFLIFLKNQRLERSIVYSRRLCPHFEKKIFLQNKKIAAHGRQALLDWHGPPLLCRTGRYSPSHAARTGNCSSAA